MLIVNADDLGLRPEVTDAILECWRAGAITSASAMVHMEDSGRAFKSAAAEGLPLGLHLNLTTPFTAADTPPDRRRRQGGAVAYFEGPRRRQIVFDLRVRGPIDSCVADQLEAFAESGARVASHGDGHQHIQVCPTVLLSRSLSPLVTLRCAQSFPGARRSVAKRAYRGAVNLVVRRRFRSVPFLSLRDLHPALGGAGLDRLAAQAHLRDIEVMVHPAWEDERQVLLSTEWRQMLAGLPSGTHGDLH